MRNNHIALSALLLMHTGHNLRARNDSSLFARGRDCVYIVWLPCYIYIYIYIYMFSYCLLSSGHLQCAIVIYQCLCRC